MESIDENGRYIPSKGKLEICIKGDVLRFNLIHYECLRTASLIVKRYIENMNITYTQKLVLYGLEYTPSDSDKTKIVNYVKSIPDKTNKEKLEMLDQFEWVTIYKNGGFKY